MPHQVTLTDSHKRILLEVLLLSQEHKLKRLRNPDSLTRMQTEYLAVAEKIYDGLPIECGREGIRLNDNLFGWFRDQLFHSGPLINTEIGRLAVDICEAAGEDRYQQYCEKTIIDRLFTIGK